MRGAAGVLAGMSGLVALNLVGGCAGGATAIPPPRMPQIGAVPPGPKPASVREVVMAAIEQADRGDPSGALEGLARLSAAERREATQQLVAAVAARDPRLAGQVALAVPAGPHQTTAMEYAAGAMVDHDLDAAVAWVVALPEGVARFDAARVVSARLVERDPRGALVRVMALPDSTGRDGLLSLAAAAWARRDAAQALGWARGLPAGELRQRITTSIGFEVAQFAPEQAGEIAGLLAPGRDHLLLLGAIGRTFVARDAVEAWAWARQLPAGEPRAAAIAGIEAGLGVGASSQPGLDAGVSAAGGSLAGRPEAGSPEARYWLVGREREGSLWLELEARLRTSPQLAAEWVGTLPALDRTDEMVDRVAREWLRTNPTAAEIWLEQNLVLPSRREQLLLEAGRRP